MTAGALVDHSETWRRSFEVIGHHNLAALAREIHDTYFPSHELLAVEWGRENGRGKRRSIRLGSYHSGTPRIRIHPRLNAADVPAFFVQSIIYHEYLHHVVGPSHGIRFHRREQQFRFYHAARDWLRMHLPVLLGRRKTPRPPKRPALRPARRFESRQLPLF